MIETHRTPLGTAEDLVLLDRLLDQNNPIKSSLTATRSTETVSAIEEPKAVPLITKSNSLKRLPVHERIAIERERNVLKNWRKHNRQWERFKAKISRKLDKDESQLVMSRASEYREQTEEYSVLQKATPLHMKHGSEYWLMSLRGEGIRYVPVGNIFSGLFCPVKDDNSPAGEMIRRPLGNNNNTKDDSKTPKSWKSSHALLKRKQHFQDGINRLRPHFVPSDNCSGLRIQSHDLIQWAAESSDEYTMSQGKMDTTQQSHEAMTESPRIDPESIDMMQGISGPSFQVTPLEVSPTELDGELRLSFSLTIENGNRASQHMGLKVQNNGMLALSIKWERVNEAGGNFVLENETGTVLPGQDAVYFFSFSATVPGSYLEKWHLHTSPLSKTNSNPVVVHLNATVVDKNQCGVRFRHDTQRKISQTVIKSEEVEDTPVEVTESVPLVDEEKQLFNSLNETLGLYYSPSVINEFKQIHEAASELIQASSEETCKTEWDFSVSSLQKLVQEASCLASDAQETEPRAEEDDEEDEEDDEGYDSSEEQYREALREHDALFVEEKSLTGQLNRLVQRCRLEPYDDSVLYKHLYHLIGEFCGEIPILSSQIRDQVKLNPRKQLCIDSLEHHSQLLNTTDDEPVRLYLNSLHDETKDLFKMAMDEAVEKTWIEMDKKRRIEQQMDLANVATIDDLSSVDSTILMHLDLSDAAKCLNEVFQKIKPRSVVLISSDSEDTSSTESILPPLQEQTGLEIHFCPTMAYLVSQLNDSDSKSQVFLLEYVTSSTGNWICRGEEEVSEEEDKPLPLLQQLMSLTGALVLDTIDTQFSRDVVTCPNCPKLRALGPTSASDVSLWTRVVNSTHTCAIVGGRNVSSKLRLIDSLLNSVDEMFLGGLVGATVLQYLKRHSMGSTRVDYECLGLIRSILSKASRRSVRLHFPMDNIVGNNPLGEEEDVSESEDEETDETEEEKFKSYGGEIKTAAKEFDFGWYVYDIGPKSTDALRCMIQRSDAVVWSGLLGAIEYRKFQDGTRDCLKSILENQIPLFSVGTSTANWLNRLEKTNFKPTMWRKHAIEGSYYAPLATLSSKTNLI